MKKLYFKRDAFIDKDKEYIDKVLKRHLVKNLFKQIENTFNYIIEQKYGLIVIPDVLFGFKMITSYLKKQFEGKHPMIKEFQYVHYHGLKNFLQIVLIISLKYLVG